MPRVLEAVPNFSEGRDVQAIVALVETIAAFDVDVLDWSSDPDHHRSVVTYIGPPAEVERASLAAGRFALKHFDLRPVPGSKDGDRLNANFTIVSYREASDA